ncbi:MAG: BT4734/BF3469 family protein [Candidatus Aphodosoma sp.]
MKSFNEIEITVYRGVKDRIGHLSTLHDFLTNVNVSAIAELRSCTDAERKRQIKMSLPQATISGVFSPTRSAGHLVRHSGLICVDIDRKDNGHIANFDTLIADVLSRIEEVAYAAHSVSGKGYFVIIPLRYPQLHKAQFEQLVRVFADMGINIDRACGDVCRLRCQSYDEHPYINLDAKPFSGIYREPKKPRVWCQSGYAEGDVEEKVARLCREVAMRHIDLTANYEDWVKIGAALSSLGESGRQWFHLCSSQNSGYNPAECDCKFNNLLRSTRQIGIGTFFYYCQQFGIE